MRTESEHERETRSELHLHRATNNFLLHPRMQIQKSGQYMQPQLWASGLWKKSLFKNLPPLAIAQWHQWSDCGRGGANYSIRLFPPLQDTYVGPVQKWTFHMNVLTHTSYLEFYKFRGFNTLCNFTSGIYVDYLLIRLELPISGDIFSAILKFLNAKTVFPNLNHSVAR